MTSNYKKVLLLIESSRTFGRELLYGIVRYSRNVGGWTFYWEASGIKHPDAIKIHQDVDGIILRDSMDIQDLSKIKVPMIFVHHEKELDEYVPTVVTDSNIISKLAGEHLLSKGLKNFAFCGFSDFGWSGDREKAFSQFISNAGYNVSAFNTTAIKNPDLWYNEFSALQEWLNNLPKPAGIMACNDDRALHILEACKVLGIKIPEEIAVIGVDNDSIVCELSDPPLTSIALNTESAGFSAASLLDKLMNGEKINGQKIVVTGTHVVQRQSTDLLAINNEDLKKALRFIRNNQKSKITVDDVVACTKLSRRSLELHFKKTIRRTISDEIRRVRVESISKLLIETNLTISEITQIFNFTDIEHISRYFNKEKGMGLRSFRKLNQKCTQV